MHLWQYAAPWITLDAPKSNDMRKVLELYTIILAFSSRRAPIGLSQYAPSEAWHSVTAESVYTRTALQALRIRYYDESKLLLSTALASVNLNRWFLFLRGAWRWSGEHRSDALWPSTYMSRKVAAALFSDSNAMTHICRSVRLTEQRWWEVSHCTALPFCEAINSWASMNLCICRTLVLPLS